MKEHIGLRLTKMEWVIVGEQCHSCIWWKENLGCDNPLAMDYLPEPECRQFKEGK